MTEQHAIKKPNERPININGVVFHCYEVGRFRIEWRSEDGKKRVGQHAGTKTFWACSNGFYSHRRFYSLYNAMKAIT